MSKPKFLKNNFFYNVQTEEMGNKELIDQSFSPELEKNLSEISDNAMKLLLDFEKREKEKELKVSATLKLLIQKYFIINYYRTLLHETLTSNKRFTKFQFCEKEEWPIGINFSNNKITQETLESDLEILLSSDTLEEIEYSAASSLLKFTSKQLLYGYFSFWVAPDGFEFFISDNIMTKSNDLCHGAKLQHAIHTSGTNPENTELKEIAESLDYCPYNYVITPITPKFALVLCSPFMCLYTEDYKNYKPVFSIFNLTFSGLKADRFNKPKENTMWNINFSIYQKKELDPMEMFYNNSLIVNQAIKYISYKHYEDIKDSKLFYEASNKRKYELFLNN